MFDVECGHSKSPGAPVHDSPVNEDSQLLQSPVLLVCGDPRVHRAV